MVGAQTLGIVADQAAAAWFTDPPYYDAVPYAHLADFFFVWLKRVLPNHPLLNKQVKAGKTPSSWSARKRRHKDVDARWTKKHGVSEYGYKNHVSVDRAYGLVRRYEVTDAACHDSQVFEQVLDERNTSGDVWADSAYRSEGHELMSAEGGYRSRGHRKGQRDHPLPERSREANRKKSRVRARVEHVFGHQEAMGGKLIRTVGLDRASCKIGMMNLVFNLRRFAWLCAHRPAISALAAA